MKNLFLVVVALGAVASIGGIAYAQDSSGETVTGLMTAVTALVSGIAGIIIAILTKITEGRQDNKMVNDIIYWANQLKETDKWTHDNLDKIKTVVSVVENLSPEAKEQLAARGADMQTLTAELHSTNEEIGRIYDLIPRSATGPQVSKTE